MSIPQPIYDLARPPRRRRRRTASAPAVPQVLVTSVVAEGGGAVITFNLPVSLNELGPEETIRFDDGTHAGFAEDLSQFAADAIFVNGVPGVTIAAGCAWDILALPPCFVLPEGAVMPVPQEGIVLSAES